jgi:hypothetical protein
MLAGDYMKIARDLFTGRDNETHDVARYSWVVSVSAAIALACWSAVHNNVVDLAAFGTCIAAIVGAHGAALWAKRDTEPKEKD